MFSLATFGVGFLTRPLGALVIGRLGDRAGRKPAMVLSFTLMGIGITGVALTPSYAHIGIVAPILLLTFRLLQGFALGGQVGPSTAFLIEAAPPQRRGLYVAVQYMTQDLAVLAAGLIGYALSNFLSAAALDSWGWRLAFLLGAAGVPFGVYLRGALPETLTAKDPAMPLAAQRRAPLSLFVLALLLLIVTTIGGYGLSYMTTYAQDSLRLAAGVAFGATVMNGIGNVIGDISSGLCSDRTQASDVVRDFDATRAGIAGVSRNDSLPRGLNGLPGNLGTVHIPAAFRQRRISDDRRVTANGHTINSPRHTLRDRNDTFRWHHPVGD